MFIFLSEHDQTLNVNYTILRFNLLEENSFRKKNNVGKGENAGNMNPAFDRAWLSQLFTKRKEFRLFQIVNFFQTRKLIRSKN